MFTRLKVLIAISFSSAIFLLVALFLLSSNLGRVIRNGLVILGPVVTRTAWSLEDVEISPWGGEGHLTNLRIANPPGYFRDNAVDAPLIEVDVEEISYFDDVMVIESFRIADAQIRFEIAGQPRTNLQVLLESLNSAVIGQSQLAGELRLSVPELVIEDVGAAEGGISTVEAIQRTLGPSLEAARQTMRGFASQRGDEIQRRLQQRIEQLEAKSGVESGEN